ncbi:peptidylprolyl isomerase [Anaeromyxobacter diazotrophicus]|uniref:PpiC domain-containing protein n=1 Tax=Anaeromyxobacter diazotrophicus TaxID=2590199 RepID=A0A7I9VM81_9BACT|nr:peptidyl-prolyl cis-trans isomerase [Anaeromyxobacter diazotrophicus]GEJ57087.1 hypothetical protein AMYX_18280 [Anaeromyxobacter diazotrophicus]
MLGLLLAAALAVPPSSAVVARVEDEAITSDEVAARAQDAGLPMLAALEAEIREVLLAQAARAEGLQREPELAQAVAAARRQLAVESLLEAEVWRAVRVTRADLVPPFHAREDQVRLSLVLRATREEAERSLARLRGGESLIDEAKGSPDPIIQSKSGVLGWVARRNLAPALAEAAFAAPLDTPTGPVQVAKGYTIFVVHEREIADEARLPEADPELRAEAEHRLRQAALERYVAGLRQRQARADQRQKGPPAALDDQALLEREALARGHGRGPEVEAQLQLFERKALARALARRTASAAGLPSDREIEARYREQLAVVTPAGARPFQEVRAVIGEQLRRERAQAAVDALVARLRRGARVVLDEGSLPPPPSGRR